MSQSPSKDVYNIIENEEGKSRWVRVGTAFVNRDSSINVKLDVFPTEGKLQIRERSRRSKSDNEQQSN